MRYRVQVYSTHIGYRCPCESPLRVVMLFFFKEVSHALASLLQPSVSHDPSEIILICQFYAQETFLIIINAESSCAAKYSCGK